MKARSPRLQHRPSRTIPAIITATVLVGIGVLSMLVAVVAQARGSWPAPARGFGGFLTDTRWGSPGWLMICLGVGVLGLIMVISALTPGRLNAARLSADGDGGSGAGPQTELVMSRRGVARLAAAKADLVDGVDSVVVNAAAKKVRIQVATTSQHTTEIENAVTDAVVRTLSDAGLTPLPRVSTTAWFKGD